MKIKYRHPEKVNKTINLIKKKPEWIRSKIVDSQIFFETKKIVNENEITLAVGDKVHHEDEKRFSVDHSREGNELSLIKI